MNGFESRSPDGDGQRVAESPLPNDHSAPSVVRQDFSEGSDARLDNREAGSEPADSLPPPAADAGRSRIDPTQTDSHEWARLFLLEKLGLKPSDEQHATEADWQNIVASVVVLSDNDAHRVEYVGDAQAMGYRKVLTYTLESESGASLRAVGWNRVGVTGGGSWSVPSRPRVDHHPLQTKIRWECEL